MKLHIKPVKEEKMRRGESWGHEGSWATLLISEWEVTMERRLEEEKVQKDSPEHQEKGKNSNCLWFKEVIL